MKSRLFRAILFGLLIGVVGLLISLFPYTFSLEENKGLGLLFKLRGARQAPSDVVVVSIDKESSDKLHIPDNPDKWPRSLHARLVENLAREGAELVSFDVHFIEPRVAEDDNLFAKCIREAHNVVLCEPMKARELAPSGRGGAQAGVYSIVKIVKPIPLLADAAVATAPFPLPRIPFKVNSYWAFQTGAGDSPTLPVVTFQLSSLEVYPDFIRLLEKVSPVDAGKLPPDRETAVRTMGVKRLIRKTREIFDAEPLLGQRMLDELERSQTFSPHDRRYRLVKALIKLYAGPSSRYINYYGPPRTVTTLPYYEALRLHDGTLEGRHIDLKGKVVFVGLSEALLADRKDSFYTVFSTANGIFVSGVEIAATAFANILNDTPVRSVGARLFVPILLLWGILAGAVCRMFPIKISAPGLTGLSVLYVAVAVVLFKAFNTWLPVIVPAFFQAPLAFAGAIGIEHSRLFKEVLVKLRMEQDLSSARELQMKMLPADCPKVEGYQIAARSTPAREVGGDFFDFIETRDDKLGFIVGDVTGKSLPGALIMSASRSVFRILSEEDLSLGEIMVRANRRIKKDAKSGMFVALLYAILDPKERVLLLCNAGQTQPLHFSAGTGEVTLVETKGDNFPLGILEEADYQETQFSLAPGDKMIFYTDGVVEAMNKKEELYGFERFQEVVKNAGTMPADELLEEISGKVSAFVGRASQHDDLTVIVVGVEGELGTGEFSVRPPS
jgi:serine phosphatase RsbU (regulator of sigma subunit)/CHASE2 domain-containing sensor protein